MTSPHKFAYFGTPDFSTLVLDALQSAAYVPTLIVTTPDKPAGRGLALTESPVKKWALSHDVPVLQPETLDEKFAAALRAAAPDLFLVAAYGKILPVALLSIPKKGALNVHPSLLPRYRGTSPVESQILADEKEVGVSVILMDEKMDHGPLVAQEKIALPTPLSRNELNERLWRSGGALVARTLPAWMAGTITPVPQKEPEATSTKKIQKEDGLIELTSDPRGNYLKYLAYEGWPGVYFFENGVRMKITKARFEHDQFIVERVIPEGGREIPYRG